MKRSFLLAMTLAALAGCATTLTDTEFSLHKGNVFDPMTPAVFDFESGNAGKSLIEPLAGSGMPPMISHPIGDSLPLTASSNNCLTCHDRPGEWGKGAKGQASAAPASHYAKTPAGKYVVAGAQYNCLACHAPQAGVTPLVTNRSR